MFTHTDGVKDLSHSLSIEVYTCTCACTCLNTSQQAVTLSGHLVIQPVKYSPLLILLWHYCEERELECPMYADKYYCSIVYILSAQVYIAVYMYM